MGRYVVNHTYRSYRDGQAYGPWSVGSEMELSAEDAAWVNRDSPGTLTPVGQARQDAEEGPAEEEPVNDSTEEPSEQEEPTEEGSEQASSEREKKPARNRQHRGSTNRSG